VIAEGNCIEMSATGAPNPNTKGNIMKPTKIGILGSGDVGKTLGKGFVKYGNEVMIGTSHPEKISGWLKETGPKACVGTFSEAAAFGNIIVLAVKARAAKETLSQAGNDNLKGKTVIDATNPIADAPPSNGVISYFTTLDRSLMEQFQADHPDANFVKAFNSIGSALMVNPVFKEGTPSMFICGNSDKAKKEVAEIVQLFGFSVEDMGGDEAARAIEPLCMLWCIPGMLRNDWNHAFKLLRA
jgi:8-hydroxy-5-deazaflavin:NADPH oxidoreductase